MLFCVKHLRYTMGELKYRVHTKCNAAVCVEIDINALLEIPARDLQSCVLNFVLAPNVPEHVSVDLNFRFRNICTGRNTDTLCINIDFSSSFRPASEEANNMAAWTNIVHLGQKA